MKRSQAAYGDEAAGIPASKLFDRADAESALRDASTVLSLCSGSTSPISKRLVKLEGRGPAGEALIRRMRRRRVKSISGR